MNFHRSISSSAEPRPAVYEDYQYPFTTETTFINILSNLYATDKHNLQFTRLLYHFLINNARPTYGTSPFTNYIFSDIDNIKDLLLLGCMIVSDKINFDEAIWLLDYVRIFQDESKKSLKGKKKIPKLRWEHLFSSPHIMTPQYLHTVELYIFNSVRWNVAEVYMKNKIYNTIIDNVRCPSASHGRFGEPL
jgi:hypothetical protein